MSELPEHVARNRADWDAHAGDWIESGRRNWACDEPSWGIFGVAQSQLHVLPADLDGLDVVELGCGTGYVSAWLARRGARPPWGSTTPSVSWRPRTCCRRSSGSRSRLCTATPRPRRSRTRASTSRSPSTGRASGADPYEWIPEAARLLRPGGRLVFLVDTPLAIMCAPDAESEPAGEHLLRPYFGMHRVEWPGDDSVEFHLPHGELIAGPPLRAGFEIEALTEVQVPEGATTRFPHATVEWARRWPYEEIWKVRKRA